MGSKFIDDTIRSLTSQSTYRKFEEGCNILVEHGAVDSLPHLHSLYNQNPNRPLAKAIAALGDKQAISFLLSGNLDYPHLSTLYALAQLGEEVELTSTETEAVADFCLRHFAQWVDPRVFGYGLPLLHHQWLKKGMVELALTGVDHFDAQYGGAITLMMAEHPRAVDSLAKVILLLPDHSITVLAKLAPDTILQLLLAEVGEYDALTIKKLDYALRMVEPTSERVQSILKHLPTIKDILFTAQWQEAYHAVGILNWFDNVPSANDAIARWAESMISRELPERDLHILHQALWGLEWTEIRLEPLRDILLPELLRREPSSSRLEIALMLGNKEALTHIHGVLDEPTYKYPDGSWHDTFDVIAILEEHADESTVSHLVPYLQDYTAYYARLCLRSVARKYQSVEAWNSLVRYAAPLNDLGYAGHPDAISLLADSLEHESVFKVKQALDGLGHLFSSPCLTGAQKEEVKALIKSKMTDSRKSLDLTTRYYPQTVAAVAKAVLGNLEIGELVQ